MRHARRTGTPDRNQAQVINCLRDYGCIVDDIDRPADLLVWSEKTGLFLLEVKGADKRLRGKTQRIMEARAQHGFPWYVIREGESVANLLDLVRRNYRQEGISHGRKPDS